MIVEHFFAKICLHKMSKEFVKICSEISSQHGLSIDGECVTGSEPF